MASTWDRLQSFFGIKVRSTPQKGSVDSKPAIEPANPPETPNDVPRALKFSSEIQKLWDWWLHETHDNAKTLSNRFERYTDLEYMAFNNGTVSLAADIFADEAVQADSQSVVLHVMAKDRKVEKEIYRLLNYWKVDQTLLRNIAYDLGFYGDGFTLNNTDGDRGIVSIDKLDPFSVRDRLEFKASEAVREQIAKAQYQQTLSKRDKLKSLSFVLGNKKGDYSKFYRTFLFGFQLDGEQYLPPWNISHFRRFTSKAEFYPWGLSLFINSVALFRQLKASKNLAALARMASIPRERYQVKVSEGMNQQDQWEAVNEAREEFQNISVSAQGKEDLSIGSGFWIPQGLIEFDLVQADVNLNEIKDLEMLNDDLTLSTTIPKGYIDVDKGGTFGVSGQSLLQQFKPFGRRVFSLQSIILAELTQMIRLHFLMTSQFEREFTEFSLSMNFPVIEEARDRISMKSDTLRLAKDVTDALKDMLGVQDSLPPDILKSILSQFSFLSSDDVSVWVDAVVADQEEKSKAAQSTEEPTVYESYKRQRITERAKILERVRGHEGDILREAFFSVAKDSGLKEGVKNSLHFFISSSNITNQDEVMFDCYRKFSEYQKEGAKFEDDEDVKPKPGPKPKGQNVKG